MTPSSETLLCEKFVSCEGEVCNEVQNSVRVASYPLGPLEDEMIDSFPNFHDKLIYIT